jgi:hypothetical protein
MTVAEPNVSTLCSFLTNTLRSDIRLATTVRQLMTWNSMHPQE